LGIPTVTIATSEFISLAKETALSQGVAEMSLVIVPHPMGMIPLPEIRKKADNSFPEILKAAIQWNPMAQLPPMKSPYPAAKFKFRGPGEDVSRLFYDKGWSMDSPSSPRLLSV
jgi:hypothetical protein